MVRKDPLSVPIDRRIVERDYQLDCIDTLTREFQQGRRKMLVEMATGTGKTRTAAAFMKRLLEANAITRVLFLVDRDPLDAIIQELLHSDTPILVVLAGSKGAGKTTFYRRVLGDLLPFVNADEIGRALDPEAPQADPYAAARLADLVRRDLIAHRRSFCMETVFSDPAGEKLQFLRTAQLAGYRVVFVWIRIDSVELSMARVQQRVEPAGASTVTSAVAYLATSGVVEHAGTATGRVVVRGLTYTDRCGRIDGRWFILERVHRLHWQGEMPGGPESVDPLWPR
jgi:predicted ABC-type ATPase